MTMGNRVEGANYGTGMFFENCSKQKIMISKPFLSSQAKHSMYASQSNRSQYFSLFAYDKQLYLNQWSWARFKFDLSLKTINLMICVLLVTLKLLVFGM